MEAEKALHGMEAKQLTNAQIMISQCDCTITLHLSLSLSSLTMSSYDHTYVPCTAYNLFETTFKGKE